MRPVENLRGTARRATTANLVLAVLLAGALLPGATATALAEGGGGDPRDLPPVEGGDEVRDWGTPCPGDVDEMKPYELFREAVQAHDTGEVADDTYERFWKAWFNDDTEKMRQWVREIFDQAYHADCNPQAGGPNHEAYTTTCKELREKRERALYYARTAESFGNDERARQWFERAEELRQRYLAKCVEVERGAGDAEPDPPWHGDQLTRCEELEKEIQQLEDDVRTARERGLYDKAAELARELAEAYEALADCSEAAQGEDSPEGADAGDRGGERPEAGGDTRGGDPAAGEDAGGAPPDAAGPPGAPPIEPARVDLGPGFPEPAGGSLANDCAKLRERLASARQALDRAGARGDFDATSHLQRLVEHLHHRYATECPGQAAARGELPAVGAGGGPAIDPERIDLGLGNPGPAGDGGAAEAPERGDGSETSTDDEQSPPGGGISAGSGSAADRAETGDDADTLPCRELARRYHELQEIRDTAAEIGGDTSRIRKALTRVEARLDDCLDELDCEELQQTYERIRERLQQLRQRDDAQAREGEPEALEALFDAVRGALQDCRDRAGQDTAGEEGSSEGASRAGDATGGEAPEVTEGEPGSDGGPPPARRFASASRSCGPSSERPAAGAIASGRASCTRRSPTWSDGTWTAPTGPGTSRRG